jgi:Leucine Rich repeat
MLECTTIGGGEVSWTIWLSSAVTLGICLCTLLWYRRSSSESDDETDSTQTTGRSAGGSTKSGNAEEKSLSGPARCSPQKTTPTPHANAERYERQLDQQARREDAATSATWEESAECVLTLPTDTPPAHVNITAQRPEHRANAEETAHLQGQQEEEAAVAEEEKTEYEEDAEYEEYEEVVYEEVDEYEEEEVVVEEGVEEEEEEEEDEEEECECEKGEVDGEEYTDDQVDATDEVSEQLAWQAGLGVHHQPIYTLEDHNQANNSWENHEDDHQDAKHSVHTLIHTDPPLSAHGPVSVAEGATPLQLATESARIADAQPTPQRRILSTCSFVRHSTPQTTSSSSSSSSSSSTSSTSTNTASSSSTNTPSSSSSSSCTPESVSQQLFAAVYANDESLRELRLNSRGLTDALLFQLSQALTGNTHLDRLDLSGNAITDQGVTELATALSLNRTLTHLDLRGNLIGVLGVRALCRALRHHSVLQQLRLEFNHPDLPSAPEYSALQRLLAENRQRAQQQLSDGTYFVSVSSFCL